MYCRYCGNELDENGFCENCGIEFENHQQPPVVYVNTQQKEIEEPRTSGMAVVGFIMAISQLFLNGNISVILYWLAMIFSFVGLIITLTPFFLGMVEGYLLARGY